MKIKSVTIKDFRRFTDLTVQDIPETARLIMLAGPNGCGKSSFLDALQTWHNWTSNKYPSWDSDYHGRVGSPHRIGWSRNDVELEFHDPVPHERKKLLYSRSAYRNDPEFQITNFQRTDDPLNELRVARMIDNDAAVANNYQRLVGQAVEGIFDPPDGSMTLNQFEEQIIGDIRTVLSKMFPELELNSLGNPLEDGTFRFTKGTSRGFSFKNLSGGEKAVFDLILDLVIAKRAYDNTIFCIDEPEAHMNPKLQAKLLSVLYQIVPENCQLMLATHSIGMMRRAGEIEAENPGSVVFLDFDLEFDTPQIIQPITKPDRTFWHRAYEVAVGDLAALVAPSRVVICEGYPKTGNPVQNHSHDARCYERIFESEFPETRFVSMGNAHEIMGDKRGLAEALRLLIGGLEVVRLIDRDDKHDNTVADLNTQGVRVLSKRNLESYLFDDEVLRALARSEDQEDKADELLEKKQEILAARTEGPADDLKRASGQIYVACKEKLGLTQPGDDAREFMRETLAPLITPGMAVYSELKRDIFGAPTGSA